MQRTTFAHAQASRIGDVINVDPYGDVTRFASYINESVQRLLPMGKYWSTYSTFATALTSQFFSLPPYLDTLEAIILGGSVLPIHDLLYQWIAGGWGGRDQTSPNGSGVNEALMVGNFPTFVDVIPPGSTSTGSKLTFKCDVLEDVGQPVLLLGYDNATPPNWIRTKQGGVWTDGEIIGMQQGVGSTTINTFSKLTAVQLGNFGTPLSGQGWLYAGDTITGTLLSNYQAFEFSPSYQRYQVPFLNSTVSTINVVGKNAFIPVKNPADYLSVGCLPAVKLGCRAVLAEEESDLVTAGFLWNGGMDPKTKQRILGAKDELEKELDHFLGSGRRIGLTLVGSGYDANDQVLPII